MKIYTTTLAALLLFAGGMTCANAEIIGQNYAQINTRNSAGWQINAYFDGSRFHSCGAITTDIVAGMDELQLEFSGSDWLIGRNEITNSHYTGKIFVGTINGSLNFEQGQSLWTVAHLENYLVAALKRADRVTIETRHGDQFNYSLSGSSAAMFKTEECVRTQGGTQTTQRRQPQQRLTQQPTPRRQNNVRPQRRRQNNVQPQPRRQNNVAHKAQLSGTWIWSDPVKHSKNNLIVSTIKLTGTNTANYCYGLFCWDVTFTMGTNNTVKFSTDGINSFSLYDEGPNALHGEFWENGNTQASPDARVSLR